MPKTKRKPKSQPKKSIQATPSETKKYTILFTEEEHKKYTELVNKTHHKTMSALIRDALNAVSLNPSLLDSTRDTNFEELIAELKDSYGDRNKEDQVFRDDTTRNIERLQKKINLLLKQANVDRTVIKAIDGEDITGEVIFDD